MKKGGFYAVRYGRRPGIYSTWSECEAQIRGFSGARYKKFKTSAEAEHFVSAHEPMHSVSSSSTAADASSSTPSASTSSTVVAAKLLKHQISDQSSMASSINSSAEDLSNEPSTPGSIHRVLCVPDLRNDNSEQQQNSTLRVQLFHSYSSTATNVSDPNRHKRKAVDMDDAEEHEIIVVYTDGCSLNNGQSDARAGVGVFFGLDDPRNISEPLPTTSRMTNQRAELTAALRALDQVDSNADVEIRTDSHYVIKGMTEWIQSWKLKDWKVGVMNLDLFQQLDERIRERQGDTLFRYVAAHTGILGNEMADQLAKNGARQLTS